MLPRIYLNSIIYTVLIAFAITLQSCHNGTNAPNVSDVKVQLHTSRFDRDLAAIDTNHMVAGLQQLHSKYPEFLDFYLDTLMGFQIKGNYTDTNQGIQQGLRTFLTYKDYKGLFDSVNKHFPDTKNIDAALTGGFQYMLHYFPNYQVPAVMYVTSGLNNWGAFTYQSKTLGIGLDMFLGGDYPFYKSVGIPNYMYTHLRPDYIPVAAFSAIYEDSHPLEIENNDLLQLIIQKGKEQYFLHQLLPETPDSTMFAFSQAQVNWCKDNEAEVYNFFIRQNLFYNKEVMKTMRYVTDGPSATGMPPQSPGNVGSWLGLQIVNAYMQQHTDITLQKLLTDKTTDAQTLLEKSKYKPK